MNTPTTFNELMTVISGHVSTYLNERVVCVVSLLCEKYDLSYDEVILSIPETTNLTCPIVSKKYKKKIKFVVSDSNEESIVPVPETNPPPIKPKKRPAKKVPEPETLVVEEEQGTVVPETPLIKPKKRPAKKVPEPETLVVEEEQGTAVPEPETLVVEEEQGTAVPEPETLVVEEEQGTAVPEAPLIKPKKRPAKKVPEPETLVVEEQGTVVPEAPLIKPKKRPAKKVPEQVPEPETLVVEEQGTAVPEAPLIKPKKRPAKKTPEQAPASGTTNDKRPAKKPRDSPKQKDIQIDDLPSDEASWFNEILGKSGHPEIAKSFFPSRPMLLPDCDVYSDDGIVDDYEDESIKYVTDE